MAHSRSIAAWQLKTEDSALGPAVTSAQALHPMGLAGVGMERKAALLLSF